MVQRTVLKVDISCQKCKKKILRAVSGLQGVDKIELDAAKGTLTVTGDADPVRVISRARKTGKSAEVISIGPPPAPPKQDAGGGQKKQEEKKVDDKKPEQKAQVYVPQTCPVCEQMGVDKIELDAAKGTLTVTGDADPVQVISRARKTGKSAEVISIGPPPAPPKQDAGGGQKKQEEKKVDDKKPEQKAQIYVPQTCPVCKQMGVHIRPYDTHIQCSIL
ncbi:heavy metal-associated isoprenylated plant protein 43-like [Magnolia sinica]|uniref:heavy metal-associated isoprenylated plant protein 43-like n=1 Tax=Magnolia sinica TaxID=86752 RepID=UPI00265A2D5D|nr:heavy metal-associated isoprenylated plant protein 43-like [Magnolia sinica]